MSTCHPTVRFIPVLSFEYIRKKREVVCERLIIRKYRSPRTKMTPDRNIRTIDRRMDDEKIDDKKWGRDEWGERGGVSPTVIQARTVIPPPHRSPDTEPVGSRHTARPNPGERGGVSPTVIRSPTDQ
jgi:hypothetical protein